jgi:hypothetical protein
VKFAFVPIVVLVAGLPACSRGPAQSRDDVTTPAARSVAYDIQWHIQVDSIPVDPVGPPLRDRLGPRLRQSDREDHRSESSRPMERGTVGLRATGCGRAA